MIKINAFKRALALCMLLLNDGGYVTFRRLKQEAKQGIGELDWPLIFVPSPVRIAKRFVDTGNSSVCHLTTKMQKGISISVEMELNENCLVSTTQWYGEFIGNWILAKA